MGISALFAEFSLEPKTSLKKLFVINLKIRVWGGCYADDNGRVSWRRNAGCRRIIRWLVPMRGSKDLNQGHEIMGCIYRKRWSVRLYSFPGERVSGRFQTGLNVREMWGR